MGISQIMGLTALLGIPFIIILYMLKPKHQNREVASTYLWQQVFDEIESASTLHRLRKSILLLLEILAILLITAILAGVFLKNVGSSQHHILVLDGSISMQSTDIKPTRFDEAKKTAIDYLKQLDDDVIVSVVVLKETPEILFREEEDIAMVRDGLRQIQPSMNYVDPSLAYETIQALAGEYAYDLAYFGDQSFKGARIYPIGKDERNLSIHDVSVTAYAKGLSALTEVFNHGNDVEEVMVSLYVDDLYLTTKSIPIDPLGSTQVLFDQIPKETKIIKVVVDTEDRLNIDNTAYAVVQEKTKAKVAYYSEGNLFLEKVMALHEQLDVYEVDASRNEILTGYDIYLFDSFVPAELPTDGNILMIDPQNNTSTTIQSKGYIENPKFKTVQHPITYLIDKPEFNIAVTQVFDIKNTSEERKDSIYETEHGSIAYSWEDGRNRGVVFGFDFRYSDLPLGIEFPILMTNTFDYLMNQSALENNQVSVGEAVEIRLFPNTENAWILTPSGYKHTLLNEEQYITYREASQPGIYSLIQQSGDEEKREYFAVNTPQRGIDEGTISSGQDEEKNYATGKDLSLWLGTATILVLLIEWLIYTRRKRYAR